MQVPKGAWFTLVLSTVLTLITYTWHWGQEQKLRYIRRHAVPLRTLLTEEPSSAAGPTAPLLGGGGAGAGGVGRGSNPSRASISTASSAKEGVEGWAGGAPALRLEGGQEVSRVPGVGLYYNELLTGEAAGLAAGGCAGLSVCDGEGDWWAATAMGFAWASARACSRHS